MSDLSVAAVQAAVLAAPVAAPRLEASGAAAPDFAAWMAQGLHRVNGSLAQVDATVRAVAMGEPVAPHQAMLAMEQARLDLQLVLQVRNRVLEGVQELMRMQL